MPDTYREAVAQEIHATWCPLLPGSPCDTDWAAADAALAVPNPDVESVTEWGVRWEGGLWSPPTQGVFAAEDVAEDAVRKFAAELHPGYKAVVVSRLVSRTEWREVDGDG